MALEIVTRRGNLLFNGMNDYWRRGRKFAQAQLSTMGVRSWQGIQAAEACRLVCDLVKDPTKYNFLFERYSTIVSLRQGFGKTVDRGPQEDSHARKIMSLMHVIEKVGSPYAYMVDVLPILLRVPDWLAPFKQEGKILHEQESSYFLGLLADARKFKEEGQPEDPPSFACSYLDKPEYWNLSNFEAAYTIGTLYGGGSGTTSSSMQTYCLAMCHYPEWQNSLQEEIDQVVGNERIPRFDDMPHLHTIRAVIKEILRWRPVVTGGSWTSIQPFIMTICANKTQQASHIDLPGTTSTKATLYPPEPQFMQTNGPYTKKKRSTPTQRHSDPSAGWTPRTRPSGRH
jgi:cytochrome P450